MPDGNDRTGSTVTKYTTSIGKLVAYVRRTADGLVYSVDLDNWKLHRVTADTAAQALDAALRAVDEDRKKNEPQSEFTRQWLIRTGNRHLLDPPDKPDDKTYVPWHKGESAEDFLARIKATITPTSPTSQDVPPED